jgi:hypothetical protein
LVLCGVLAALALGGCALARARTSGVVARHARLAHAGAVALSETRELDPFSDPAMRAFIAARAGNITAAVYDVRTRTAFLYRPGVQEQTASIVKANILIALLHGDELRGTSLSAADAASVSSMIEQSNNVVATPLWNEAGAQSGIAAFDRSIGMTATVPAYDWGDTLTSASDQLQLLRCLLPAAAGCLNAGDRAYALGLMEHVEPFEAWGVSSGPAQPGGTATSTLQAPLPATVTVALKNGWAPRPGIVAWQVNSIGLLSGDGRDYLIAVLTNANPNEAYGIATIDGIAARVWSALAPQRHPHTAGARAGQSVVR